MRQLLENEGILFLESGRVDLKRYGWYPNTALSTDALQGLLRLLRTDIASPFRVSSSEAAL